MTTGAWLITLLATLAEQRDPRLYPPATDASGDALGDRFA